MCPEIVVGFGIKVFLHAQKTFGICVCAGLGEIGPTQPGANKLKRFVEIGGALTDLLFRFYIALHQCIAMKTKMGNNSNVWLHLQTYLTPERNDKLVCERNMTWREGGGRWWWPNLECSYNRIIQM